MADEKRVSLSPLAPSESNKRHKVANNNEETRVSGISNQSTLLVDKFPRLSDDLLEKITNPFFRPAVDALMTISEADFSEEDPLLLVLPSLTDADSIAYWNMGNYGLPEGTPGHRAWPGGAPPVTGQAVAAGVDALPPNALGGFLRQQAGFTDKSHGHGLVFSVSSLSDLDRAIAAMQGSRQFVRYGPVSAGEMGIPPQPPLVEFALLTTLTGVPQILTRFNNVS